ncbi:TrlF family AAA-like ATPase [Pseudomonas gessardii]|uniref:TrlF family AAA-like ATPase n=1 Tax=Pseudomonas gessardii TaxID=78544 RepID=UPI0018D60D4E|nr:AAA family ATPase [Pseudomonas gessardii]MBH3425486.1 AAA family ATPase [Pseudomonas gessardii]
MIGRGSEWCRWEPHIHAPGTVLNNQFGGKSPWDDYLIGIEMLTPKIEALAVTDYYLTETYEKVLEFKRAGRLPDVQLIFPNVEIRLDVAAKRGFVNAHLLVCPDDPDHLEQLQRILQRLQFQAHDDTYNCTRADLITLGKRADNKIIDDHAALRHGATQFKVNFDQLRRVLRESEWAKTNILVAVAAGSGDGTSGIHQAADATVRQEIERFAHIIFSSNPGQREYWSGQRSVTQDDLKERYNGCKPCLHGSDAHDHKTVGQPTDERYSWIKGGLEFDALRQACIDPEGRAYVGSEPPRSAMPSQVISHLSISNADWMANPEIQLNPGLVAIIGARGSGKTALADMIAAACDAIPTEAWNTHGAISPSFLARANKLMGEATATLTWGGGTSVTRFLDGRDANDHLSFPRARYLSQQFVEELCSSNGVSDSLIAEIERVIYDTHPHEDREGAIDFEELREYRTSRFKHSREREVEAILELSDRIATEIEKEASVATLKAQVAQKVGLLENYSKDRAKLVVKGSEVQAARHTEVVTAVQAKRTAIQQFTNQRRAFVSLQDEVKSTRSGRAPELLRQAKERYQVSNLSAEQWEEFLLIYKGDVDKSLSQYITWADGQINAMTGPPLPPPATGVQQIAYFPADADLTALTLSLLTAEMNRLETVIGADKVVRAQYTALTQRITQESAALETLKKRLTDAEGSNARRKDLQTEREEAYGRVFQAIESEQDALLDLYAPLLARLAQSSGTLKKLGFTVRRIVNVNAWGAVAEESLLDRRKAGPFQGRGALIEVAERMLRTAWETGSAADVQAAMAVFIETHQRDLLRHAPYGSDQQAELRGWLKQFAHWLFDTDHITVRYEIIYDGTDIRKLSPGTRGIVLLLLYLALDEADDRPLIIDQPEENLDPKSVFEELVGLFINAKSKRQVIMVTHNANLVINTDADQIIVADAGPHSTGGLPLIAYKAGGLENASIRKAVCDILEGGEQAFRERARRLRVRLDR